MTFLILKVKVKKSVTKSIRYDQVLVGPTQESVSWAPDWVDELNTVVCQNLSTPFMHHIISEKMHGDERENEIPTVRRPAIEAI